MITVALVSAVVILLIIASIVMWQDTEQMKAPKQTREERIRVLENIVMIFNDRIKNLENIIYDVKEDDKQNLQFYVI